MTATAMIATKNRIKRLLALSALLLISELILAQSIVAEAVLGNLVVLNIDGQRSNIRVGESKQNVTVISADNNYVDVEIAGKPLRLRIGAAAVTSRYTPSTKTEKILRNEFGMYTTRGAINKKNANFIIDTGATFVAISEQHAQQFGIDYKRQGTPTQVSTANGIVPAYFIRFDSVTVGTITLSQVEGVVVTGGGLPEILLGMSFLNRVDVSYSGGIMTMEAK